MKKIIGILTAVMMLFSCLTFSASAATSTSLVGEVTKVGLGHTLVLPDGGQTRIGTYSITIMWPSGKTTTYHKTGFCQFVPGDIVYYTSGKIEHAPASFYRDIGKHSDCDENHCNHIHNDGTYCAYGKDG